ncbi:PspC domain-containing protein [Paenibacillus sabinae]|uniref:Stress-responsive transcriptional regulator n=1 Tax=Paenibacillus sabinae T27 TaxID=1268072 RepID=X4ZXB5_9BACL|nr:PspC domain-containing protein [Paenibacillus sabinae]AHV96319.1 stress-responsive transcriptional regulator [Paenibacillus sabinae T27]
MKKLYRSERDKKFSGLCGGLAQWLGIDSTIIRLVAVIVALGSFGSFILFYLIASLIIPSEPTGSFMDGHHYY